MKYRHRGYRDDERQDERERPSRPPRRDPDLPGGRLADRQRVIRSLKCHHCGSSLPVEQDARGEPLPIRLDAECSHCGSPVHACRNCVHFDPDAAFECRRKVRQQYRKVAANDCESFEPKLAVEMTRDDSRTDGSAQPTAALRAPRTSTEGRKAFEDLFDK